MATTNLLLNGFSIIGDPQTNASANQGGQFKIKDGTAVFEGDDVVVFVVDNATVDGVLTDDSVVVQVIVYDNATDYFNDVAKYTYDAPPGGGGEIDEGRKTMGDRYIEFDASSLTSSDPGAPVLDEVAAVAGVDILGELANSNGPYNVPTNEDIDLNGDGVIDPDEEGDGSFSSDLNILTENSLICFAAGTLIETPDGPRAIETLKVGDPVSTLDEGAQPIRWIGGCETIGQGLHAPVCIGRGVIGNLRDLWVSQNHRVLVRGAQAELLFGAPEVLVAAKHLVDGRRVRIVPRRRVTYWHFLLDAHQLVFAEACATESLYPGQESLNAVTDEERDEIVALFPELQARTYAEPMTRRALKRHEAEAWRLTA